MNKIENKNHQFFGIFRQKLGRNRENTVVYKKVWSPQLSDTSSKDIWSGFFAGHFKKDSGLKKKNQVFRNKTQVFNDFHQNSGQKLLVSAESSQK